MSEPKADLPETAADNLWALIDEEFGATATRLSRLEFRLASPAFESALHLSVVIDEDSHLTSVRVGALVFKHPVWHPDLSRQLLEMAAHDHLRYERDGDTLIVSLTLFADGLDPELLSRVTSLIAWRGNQIRSALGTAPLEEPAP